MSSFPITYQEISDSFSVNPLDPFTLREQTIKEIEKKIETPLICYTTSSNMPNSSIEEDDITGFNDLIYNITGEKLGVFLISNGGSPSAAERIIKLIRAKFKTVDFYIAGNAYSAATMMCFSGDNIVMLNQGTLGPIDPQINGIPAYAILNSFNELEEKLKKDGAASIAAYMPLIAKYDLPLLELCKNAQDLSKELAQQYLENYMFKTEKGEEKEKIDSIVKFFIDYAIHKTHGRSIDRDTAIEKGLKIKKAEDIKGLADLLLSLHNQYKFFLEKSGFVKLFENSRGIHWGMSAPQLPLPIIP
ncbi:SDH family Clp fold serine proteinase [Treponema pedis]|uniref:SDH family Clp fold serine proteinase n=1 Tax=Treponema pedis TaxID=409322 RepID=UPI0004020327|nr:hypothetical protein [Treponema pedis]